MRNRYPGICYVCGKKVERDKGHFERHRGSWRVQCANHPIEKRQKEADELKTKKGNYIPIFTNSRE